MHNGFYASGFLYHPGSEKILLQQHCSPASTSSAWFLFGVDHSEDEKPETVFSNVISELLGIKMGPVHPIYSYFNETIGKQESILYSLVKKAQEFPPKNDCSFGWFSFKDILKLQITEQTKHDIVVGQRVIGAALRKSRGEHTFQ